MVKVRVFTLFSVEVFLIYTNYFASAVLIILCAIRMVFLFSGFMFVCVDLDDMTVYHEFFLYNELPL